MSSRVVLAPDVPELAALGAEAPEDFLEGGARLVTGARVERLERTPGHTLLRVPLPGTPDATGQRVELPRGAGTGWLRVHVYERGPLTRLGSRWGAPPSSSPAARRWNLLCHLRAQGVGAARPLALLEAGRGLGQLSVCVEAELTGFVPLRTWLASARGEARERGLRALGLALAALERSGVRPPRPSIQGVLVADDLEAGDDDCAALAIQRLRDERAQWAERGLERARLPAIAFDDLEGARQSKGPLPREPWLSDLDAHERDLVLAAWARPGSRAPRPGRA